MSPILRIIIGLGITGVGAFFVIRTRVILGFFGPFEWAERKLGGGGSNLFYKLLGIVVCIIGIIVTTNLWNAFLEATLGGIVPKSEV
ncbi:MAG TPA: hypothetical protein VN397_05070 [Candidatus Methylomirabilis sp.]|nr:hypothetical protein [Candidatus Methylomirabilis sp.]